MSGFRLEGYLPVKLALVGSGYMATEYLKASRAINGLEIVGISSRNLNSASELAKSFDIPYLSASHLDLAANSGAHVLLVCVPELAAVGVISDLLRFQLPIVAEKPVGLSLAEAHNIEMLAVRFNTPLYVALNRRFYSSTLAALAEINSAHGARFIRVVDQQNQIAAMEAMQPLEVVHRWMFANSIHIIDYIRFLARGRVDDIQTEIIDLGDSRTVRNSRIHFDSGDKALYTAYWNTPAKWSVDVSINDVLWQFAPLEESRVMYLDRAKSHPLEVNQNDLDFKPGLVKILEEVMDMSLTGKSKLTTISEANATMELIEALYARNK